jgi:alkylation response protein AidB-like acyl-CoA dehydrogenase
MATPYFSRRDLQFNLYELLQVEQLTQWAYFADHSRESFELVLDAAGQIADRLLRPLLTDMDRQEPQLEQGRIRVHPGMRAIMQRFGDDGWINATFSYGEGGQQLPAVVHNAAAFIFQAANYSASVYPFLTSGAANLIRSFGSRSLIDTFTPPMYAGRWQGTMALTEPDAGSSLSDISTTASPTGTEGTYRIKGQKIYISCGDHDACDNVVHLLLARIEGAPAGTRGISLFVVPRQRLGREGLEPNDVLTAGIYHKMGYKGAPIAHLMLGSHDDCEGYLVGQPQQGLSYMFQMMNEARVGVGMNAAAIATAAYHASLQYARERPQGRLVSQKDPLQPQVLIIRHADVKRMLLFQKAVVEGSLALLLHCSLLADLAHAAEGARQQRATLLLDLLTPVAKSYPSEMGCLSTSAAVQVLGGAGYTTDFPVEQYYREARIHPIHEGTTGIHGLDLLGRKVLMHDGLALRYLLEEMEETIGDALEMSKLTPLANDLIMATERLQQVTDHLRSLATQGPELFLADATLYLELFGLTTLAWQWLRQAVAAQKALPAAASEADQHFYEGKLMTARYFFAYELVKTEALATRLTRPARVTTDMRPEWF